MGSITTWTRLEPRGRDANMTQSVQARLYDPLWLLARQWQVGEFRGEDAGTPVSARWRAEMSPLTRFHPGSIGANTRVEAATYDAGVMPLEALVERQQPGAATTDISLRLAVEAGAHFLRLLAQPALTRNYRSAFVARFALAAPTVTERARTDAETLAWWELMAQRAIDARSLRAAVHDATGRRIPLPTTGLLIAATDRAEIEQAIDQWLIWLASLCNAPAEGGNCWDSERMAYAFSVAGALADGEVPLTATDYTDGHIDWHTVDLDAEVSLGAARDRASLPVVRTVMPAPVSFRGAPTQRFWEFEDARLDLGQLPAAPSDLPQLLLSEFATCYGNDWYVIPIDLPVGTITRARSLLVTDTFGVQTLIRPHNDPSLPHSDWSMFSLAQVRRAGSDHDARPASNLFFLAPSVVRNTEGRASEEVLFMRDEMANVVWAIERCIAGPLEQPLDLHLAATSHMAATPSSAALPLNPAGPPTAPRYRISTAVPANWVPLLPQRTTDQPGAPLRLVRAAMYALDSDTPTVRAAQGLLLQAEGRRLALREEEVPRGGIRVTRNAQYTRWFNGSSHLWVGCRKQVGRGEGASGLRFDIVDGDR
ncbi:MAG: hypothetical protein RJA98_1527 [Pseudomonadota bacterium]|jgi:hypothetical protein